MKKILFFTAGKNDPSTRFRAEQFFPYLNEKNYFVKELISYPSKYYTPTINNKYVFLIYFAFFFLIKTVVRLFQIPYCLWYDIIFIQRELVPFGLLPLEKIIVKLNPNVIFDFDDAIFIYNNEFKNYLNKKQTIPKILKSSKLIITGNNYLASYSKKFNDNTIVIPTALDTNIYTIKKTVKKTDKIVLGWMGTHSNLKYLYDLKKVFEKISKENPQVIFKIVTDKFQYEKELSTIINTEYKHWSKTDEISDLQGFDIGIMPLARDEWTKGKCGFKLIQYMATGVPSVASNYGANKEIVKDGINGFLADNEMEWINKLTLLIKNDKLRDKFAKLGRKRIVESYSINSVLPQLIKVFDEFIQSK